MAFAEFERDLIIERTQAGREIARTHAGYREGRRPLPKARKDAAVAMILDGKSYKEACKATGLSRSTILRAVQAKGRDGLAGEISCAFDRSTCRSEEISAEQVAEKIVGFVRFWNPHRIVLYHEGITPDMEGEIRSLCAVSLPERFMPELILGRPLREDYRRGVHALAVNYLESLAKTGENS